MRDRTADFKLISGRSESQDNAAVTNNLTASGGFMEEFFEEIDELRSSIHLLETNVEEVKKIQASILSSPLNDSQAKASLDEMMDQIKKTTVKVRGRMKRMEQSLADEEPDTGESADFRIRRSQLAAINRKFIEVLSDYNKAQTEYRERCTKRIQRQLDIAGKSVEQEELEQLIESGTPGILTQGIITDTQTARQTLADIDARHNDIMRLEKSIRELHDMFMDMATIVETQGEMIDRIDYNVEKAVDYVDSATSGVKKATQFQSKARKKKIFLFIFLAVLLVVLLIVILTSVL